MNRNAGLYIRVSTEHQAKEGYSVAAQKNNLAKFAKENQFNIFSIYSDEGISGKNIQDRPEIKRLIDDIKLGRIDVVLIYKFDRLTRNVSDTEDIIDLIQQYEISIYTLSEGMIDASTPQGKFVTRLKGAVAQLEREQTVERIKVAFVQKVKEGYSLCSSTTCYGYNRKKGSKSMTINKQESFIVKRIFRMYIENNTFTSIARALNEECILTKQYGRVVKIKSGKKVIGTRTIKSVWQPKTIKLILSNPTYIGKVRYGIGTKQYFESKGLHKPIINDKLWNQVQERLFKIKHISRTNFPKDDVYYCGTLVCGICGKKLTTNRTIGRKKKDGSKIMFNGYRCINREKGTCTAIGMSHDKVEKAFVKILDNIEKFNTINEINTVEDKGDVLEKINNARKVINLSSKKLKEVMDMFMINKIGHNQLMYMTSKLNDKIDSCKEKIKLLELNTISSSTISKKNISKQISDHWKYLTNNEKLLFITNFVEKIVIVNHNKDRHNGKVEIINIEFYQS